MSADLKVGDMCVIVSPASQDLVGAECEIVGPEKRYQRKVSETALTELWVYCIGFHVRLADGRHMAIERECLRKKPPKSDVDGILRTDFTPAPESFEQLVERLTRTTEDA